MARPPARYVRRLRCVATVAAPTKTLQPYRAAWLGFPFRWQSPSWSSYLKLRIQNLAARISSFSFMRSERSIPILPNRLITESLNQHTDFLWRSFIGYGELLRGMGVR